MAQQTAVEFYHSKIKSIMGNWTPMMIEIFEETFEQVKQMEKNQIIDAHIEGQRVFDNYQHTQWTTDQAEEYYNKTFNK
jgi:hypothetical protein